MLSKSFYDAVPRTIDEAARIGGAGHIRIIVQIAFPLVLPGVVAVCIYTFLNAWDSYTVPLILMTKRNMKTLPIVLIFIFSLAEQFASRVHSIGKAAAEGKPQRPFGLRKNGVKAFALREINKRRAERAPLTPAGTCPRTTTSAARLCACDPARKPRFPRHRRKTRSLREAGV